jgi:hypothetical protein
VAKFSSTGDREVFSVGPWHFKQDLIVMKILTEEPCEKDGGDCRVQLLVQIHDVSLQQMTKNAIKRVDQEVGELVDSNLEGADKWDTFARIRLNINPDKGLKDRLVISLPNGKEVTALIHYERVVRVYLYCVKIGHKVEHCEEQIHLLSGINNYP